MALVVLEHGIFLDLHVYIYTDRQTANSTIHPGGTGLMAWMLGHEW
jgi:hypothetical protein